MVMSNFTYLGSNVASDNTTDVEINNRIHAASGALEDSGRVNSDNMALQSPQSVRSTRQLCFQQYYI